MARRRAAVSSPRRAGSSSASASRASPKRRSRPVTNLIDRLRSSTQLAALLGAQSSSYDIARAMDEGRIVLACPGADGARDRLIANLLVFDLLHAAKGRAADPRRSADAVLRVPR